MKFYKNICVLIVLIVSFVQKDSEENENLLKINIKNKFIRFNENQSIYRIKTNYLFLNITINNLYNITSINITNINQKEYGQYINDTNSFFYLNNISNINFISNIYSSELNLMFEKNINSECGSFVVTIEHANINKSKILENNISDYIYCNSIDSSKCGTCEEDKCSLIQCGKEIANENNYIFKKQDEVCIPKNISNQEKKEICFNFNEVDSYKQFKECIHDSNYEIYYMSSSLYLIIIWLIIAIFLIIIFYNKYIIAQKKKPFNVPIIFPESFFPNIINDDDNEQQIIRNNESIYSP